MSVEDKNIIDFISIDDDGKVVLTISDHLEWDMENEHLLILQTKINMYLGAIENGELYSKYPKAKDRNICIRIIAINEPNIDGFKFLERAKEVLTGAGYQFKFEIHQS
jgi:hypothetical protein